MTDPVIPPEWLQRRLSPRSRRYAGWIAELRPRSRPGDEFWTFDEPAPPGIHAGALGVALVRDGVPIEIVVTGIH
jgi:hypothetical protein